LQPSKPTETDPLERPQQLRETPPSPYAGDADVLYQTAPVGLCVTDRGHRYLRINQRLATLNGKTVEEHLGRSLREIRPQEAPAIEPLLNYVLETGKPLMGVELRVADAARPGGEAAWLLHFQPFVLANGEIAGVSTVAEDVSERHRGEETLRQREERESAFTEQTPVGIFRVDPMGRYLYVNRSWQETTGFSADEALGQRWGVAVHADDYERLWTEYQDMLAEGRRSHSTQYRIQRRDGRVVWVLAHWTFEQGAEGQTIGSIGSIIDITEHKRREQVLQQRSRRLDSMVAERTTALEESYRRLRKTERLATLGTFAAGIAHQINNPVGSILVAAQFALDPQASSEQVRAALLDIVTDAKRCGAIVGGLLKFAREEPTEKHSGDVNEPVRYAAATLRGYAQELGATIRLDLSPDLPHIQLNAMALGQALVNVVQNAIQAGARIVQVQTRTAYGGVEIGVSDDGHGVEAVDRGRLFDPFFTTRSEHGGSGLGLSITHGIISDHGGTVDVYPVPERGTRFVIRIPSTEA
jgi:PAS domain S-box-containing protein